MLQLIYLSISAFVLSAQLKSFEYPQLMFRLENKSIFNYSLPVLLSIGLIGSVAGPCTEYTCFSVSAFITCRSNKLLSVSFKSHSKYIHVHLHKDKKTI